MNITTMRHIRRLVACLSVMTAVLSSVEQAAYGHSVPSIIEASVQSTDNRHYAIHWQITPAGTPVAVYAATTPDASPDEMTPLSPTATNGEIMITSPLPEGRRAFFFLKPLGAQHGEWLSNRVIPLQGVANFRDLGGYRTRDGHHVRWGLLFRSSALATLMSVDYQILNSYGIRTVNDLRTRIEQERQPTHWQGRAPEFFVSSKPAPPLDIASFPPDMDAGRAKTLMVAFYHHMPDYYAPELRGIFARLLNGMAPEITHCTGGKDRTGLASAMILYALGVPRETIIHDYALSTPLLYAHMTDMMRAAKMAMGKVSPDVERTMMASDPVYIETAFGAAAAEYGSVDAYLAKKLGVGPKERQELVRKYVD